MDNSDLSEVLRLLGCPVARPKDGQQLAFLDAIVATNRDLDVENAVADAVARGNHFAAERRGRLDVFAGQRAQSATLAAGQAPSRPRVPGPRPPRDASQGSPERAGAASDDEEWTSNPMARDPQTPAVSFDAPWGLPPLMSARRDSMMHCLISPRCSRRGATGPPR